MIQFINVSKAYGNRVSALNEVSFRIEGGTIAFLCGKSMSGKTTILNIICGNEKPTSGQAVVNDWNMAKNGRRESENVRRTVGFVFQDLRIISSETVLYNLTLPLRIRGSSGREIRNRLYDVAGQLEIENLLGCMPSEVSYTELFKIAVARALISKPDIILIDEPSGKCDAGTFSKMMNVIEDKQRFGATVVIASSDENILDKGKTHFIMLETGRIVNWRMVT